VESEERQKSGKKKHPHPPLRGTFSQGEKEEDTAPDNPHAM
jgi:hypothetical protein